MTVLVLILILTKLLTCSVGDLRGHDEKCQKMQIDLQHFLESLAVCLTSSDGYVQSTEHGVKDAVKRLVNDLATKTTVNQLWYFRGLYKNDKVNYFYNP